MSTAPQAPTPQTRPPTPLAQREIRIVSHSSLFYWWPVWASGFIFALISFFSGYRMATLPYESTDFGREAKGEAEIWDKVKGTFQPDKFQKLTGQYVLIVKKDKQDEKIMEEKEKLNKIDDKKKKEELEHKIEGMIQAKNNQLLPKLHISRSKNLGVLFCAILLLVITITSIPLRGLWSVIVIVFIVFLAIIFALLDWWETILTALSFLDIRINTGGYFTISLVLFILWLVIFVLFDKQIYMVFTPGQLRVRLEIGEGETAYDTTGMTIQKQRSDLFRHWILGLGSGDLIVRTSGAQAHYFDLPNVLFLGRKVKEIEEMLRSRQVVAG